MSIPGGWKIPAAVALAAATAVGVYAVTQDEPAPVVSAGQSGLGQYPQAQHSLVQAQGSGLVQAYCTACHSLAPIVRHSGFTAEQWAAEVQKMREVYGAPIDDPTAQQITAYLQQHYTTPVTEIAGTSKQTWSEPTSGKASGE
ncbi:MAG TPA: cytochrome c [Nocardioidaceae bacterium]